LKNLRILSLQSNFITNAPDLSCLEQLQELYLSQNKLEEFPPVMHLPSSLVILDLAYNKISFIGQDLSSLQNLGDLWMNHNALEDILDIEHSLKLIPKLDTLYLEGNPLQKALGLHYRKKIKLAVPQLCQLDAECIPPSS
jgi:protein phosphatase 1 regulatory subunit 7